MSEILYILTTVAQDKLAVIFAGEELYNGPNMNGNDFHKIMKIVDGTIENIKYILVTEEQMDDPVDVIYGD